MAPDFFDMSEAHVTHSKETDVWAFGMTVYVRPPFVFILVFLLTILNSQELLTKQIPYAHFKLDPQVLLAIINYDLPPLPESSKTESQFLLDDLLWRVCMRCWQRIPEERPHMRDVILWLNMSSVSSIETGEVGFIPSYDCMGSI